VADQQRGQHVVNAFLAARRARRAVDRHGIDYIQRIVSERESMLRTLEKLPTTEWDHPTLCEGWQIRHVIGHLISGATPLAVRDLTRLVVRYRTDIDGGFDDDARRRGAHPPDTLLQEFRAIVHSRIMPPGLPRGLMWCDNVIHGLDVRVPLGEPDPGPPRRLAEVAECLSAMTWPSRTACRADGLQFVADDLDWTMGDGPTITGSIESIVLALAGRPAGINRLTGVGVAILVARP